MKLLILILSSLLLTSCVSLQSVSTSSIPKARNKMVSAESSKFMVLGFNFSNDYVDKVVYDLAHQCPQGKVEGILTKQETVDYFLFFFWTSKITAQGYCVNQNVAMNPANPRKPSADDSEPSIQE